MDEEPKFKKGDRVKFLPKYAQYNRAEFGFRGKIGKVVDSSILPNVMVDGYLLTADQKDLRKV